MIDHERVGKRILHLRRKAGFSQSTLARALGVSAQAVSKWERGRTLPDVEILLALSRLFDVSLQAMLEEGSALCAGGGRTTAFLQDAPCEVRRVLACVADDFTREELDALAQKMGGEEAPLSVSVRVRASGKVSEAELAADETPDEALRALAPALAEALEAFLVRPDRGLRQIAPRMRCPKCLAPLGPKRDSEEAGFVCEKGHGASVVEGVLDFGSREIAGELWSLFLKSYGQYCEARAPENCNPNNLRGQDIGEMMWREVERRRPRTILDVASGAGCGVGMYAGRISWPCLVVFTDLSHRILKYDRIWFEEHCANPNVRFAYLACDCARLPFADDTFDMVTSFSGFESMQAKRADGFQEAFRVLKADGCALYSMSLVEGGENTEKWRRIVENARDEDVRAWLSFQTLDEWKVRAGQAGYARTEAQFVFGELPAPDSGVFPYENEIAQWMAECLCVSYKANGTNARA